MRYHLALIRTSYYQKDRQVLVRTQRKRNLCACTVDRNINWYNQYGKPYGSFTKI